MILIGNGRLLTRDEKCPYYENGAVLEEENRIKKVGDYHTLRQEYPTADFLDAKGMVIMPGLINMHEHIYSAFARGLRIPGNNPAGFLEILEGTWWTIDRNLTLDNVYHSAMATYLECIKNGVTFVADHHASYGAVTGSLFEIAKAAESMGVRTSLAYEISDRDGETKLEEALEETFHFLNYVQEKKSNMLHGMIGLHASFTLSDDTLAKCVDRNTSHAGYHVHVAEGAYDEEHCQEKYGMSVVQRLQEKGILGPNSVAGHCIHISEQDRAILQETRTMVVHNPESNMGNAVGTTDVLSMFDEGIRVGLGTDGYTNDMLESLKVACILPKEVHKNPQRGFVEGCQMLFENNARFASHMIGDQVGILREGALADIILVDYEPLTPMNENNLNGHIAFGMNGAMTDTTIINGRVVMRNRKLVEFDERAVMSSSRRSAEILWKKLSGE